MRFGLLRHSGCLLFIFIVGSALPAQTPASVSPGTGKAMCSALTAADFSQKGVDVSGLSQANVDGTDGAYCVYQSKSGKVEFDIFFPAGANASEVSGTEKTVLAEGGGKYTQIQVAGADDAHFSSSLKDQPHSADIVVHRGKAVFDILIPSGPKSQQQLTALAQIVLGRLKH